ncbi:hypothetical protein CSV75_02615 [Sporosarcina sp. P18a]|uniref:DUF4238 domain-containing protein n=1 Tax=Sporosarcina sp. P18a TaxID=2048259 RepID=UPI000C167B64|nr:DUF4238 domain-containing protein [Sporosarcina sp. P18a]PIC80704.1 hypothetical protein CSV75_02615 [Sporosarcina sp. P18a]
MIETQAKYHHLVPQTYMSAWMHGNGTLNVEFLDAPGDIVKRNKERIAGITDFHSIKAGMPLCTEIDANIIFEPVSSYTVEYKGNILQSSLDMNRYYYDFENWIVKRVDGSLVSKKSIKREIEKKKIKDIETNWSTKYENNWASEVTKIEAAVLHAPNGSIPMFDLEYLMKFFTALDWRGFRSNHYFEEMYKTLTSGLLDDIEIPVDERILPSLKTAAYEIRYNLLLQFYRQYLSDSGVIFKDVMANLQHTNFHFLIADGPTKFITSDSPAFMHRRDDKKLVGLLPITPRILMAKGKRTEEDGLYYVTHITDEAVKRYNDVIRSNAEEFIIHQ